MNIVNWGRLASYLAVEIIFLLILYDPIERVRAARRRRAAKKSLTGRANWGKIAKIAKNLQKGANKPMLNIVKTGPSEFEVKCADGATVRDVVNAVRAERPADEYGTIRIRRENGETPVDARDYYNPNAMRHGDVVPPWSEETLGAAVVAVSGRESYARVDYDVVVRP